MGPVVNLVALVIGALNSTHVVFLCTGILGGRETVLGGTQHLGQACLSCGLDHTILGNENQVKCSLGIGTHIAAVIGIGLNEGAIGILSLLLQALIEHGIYQVLCIEVNEIVDVALLFLLDNVMLEHELDEAELLLHVLLDDDDGLVGVRYRIGFHLGGIRTGCGDVLEHLLDLGLGVVHVNVAHDDQGLVVGAIPLVVVVAQHLIGEVVHDVHRADYVALGIL